MVKVLMFYLWMTSRPILFVCPMLPSSKSKVVKTIVCRTWASFKCLCLNHLHCQLSLLFFLHSCDWNTGALVEINLSCVQLQPFSKPWANCIFTMSFLLKTHPQIMNQWPIKKLKNIHPSDNSSDKFLPRIFEKSSFARLLLFSRHLDAETLRLGKVLSGK